MQVKSTLVRGAIATLAAAAAVMVGAPSALADDGAARGRVVEPGTVGYRLNLTNGDDYIAELFTMKLSDGKTLRLYCVQIEVGLQKDVDMVERPWDKFPKKPKSTFNDNRDKINWVLHHGYPGVGLDALGKAVEKGGAKLHDGVSEREAIAATQAAVWHYSDSRDLDLDKPLAEANTPETNADVAAVYKFLTGAANTGIGEQPKPTLNIAADKTEGTAGTKIGPYTVATTGDITALTSDLPEGVKITDADGKELKAGDIKDGSKVYVDVPKDAKPGKGDFGLKATGELDTGRLFVSENYDQDPAQSLIVASSEKTQVAAKASASWTEAGAVPSTAPSTPAGNQGSGGELANTGVDTAVPFAAGGLLLAGGGAMLLLARRRRGNA